MRDRPRPGNGGVLLGVLATAVTVAVALAAIVLLGHGHPRQSTNRHPQPSAQARELTSILGVLRRPQTTADRDPALIRELRRGARDKYSLAIDGRPVLPLVRVATITPWGQRIYVVPFLAPTDQAKRRLPRRDQGAAVASTAALTTYPVTAGNGVPAEIEGGRDVGNGDYAHGEKPGSRWVMVVPDGVAKVALWPATGQSPSIRVIRQHPDLNRSSWPSTTTSPPSARANFMHPARRSGTDQTAPSSSESTMPTRADRRSATAPSGRLEVRAVFDEAEVEVMRQPNEDQAARLSPTARRSAVFVIVDNGSAHRGQHRSTVSTAPGRT